VGVNIDLIKNRLKKTLILCSATLALAITAPAFAPYSNPNWVSTNQPKSISPHPNWANHSEPQDHRAVMRTESERNQRNLQRQASIQQNQINQQNAQKAAGIYVLLLAWRSGLSQ
jgi:hypothetical protein